MTIVELLLEVRITCEMLMRFLFGMEESYGPRSLMHFNI